MRGAARRGGKRVQDNPALCPMQFANSELVNPRVGPHSRIRQSSEQSAARHYGGIRRHVNATARQYCQTSSDVEVGDKSMLGMKVVSPRSNRQERGAVLVASGHPIASAKTSHDEISAPPPPAETSLAIPVVRGFARTYAGGSRPSCGAVARARAGFASLTAVTSQSHVPVIPYAIRRCLVAPLLPIIEAEGMAYADDGTSTASVHSQRETTHALPDVASGIEPRNGLVCPCEHL